MIKVRFITVLVFDFYATEAYVAGDGEEGRAGAHFVAAVVLYASEAAAHGQLDGEPFRNDDGGAGEAHVKVYKGVPGNFGPAEIQDESAKGRMNIGPFKLFSSEGDFLFAKRSLYAADFFAVSGDGLEFAVALRLADILEKQQFKAETDDHSGQGQLPHYIPGDDIAGSQKEQDAHGDANARTHFIAVCKQAEDTGNDNEKSPPSLGGKIKGKNAQKGEGPKDTGGNESQAEENFEGLFHSLLLNSFTNILK
jgi:hypothetical protein